jgi:hypothetical protein
MIHPHHRDALFAGATVKSGGWKMTSLKHATHPLDSTRAVSLVLFKTIKGKEKKFQAVVFKTTAAQKKRWNQDAKPAEPLAIVMASNGEESEALSIYEGLLDLWRVKEV